MLVCAPPLGVMAAKRATKAAIEGAESPRMVRMTADSRALRGYYFPHRRERRNSFSEVSAMSPNAALHRFEYDGWFVVIELDGSTLEGVSSGHADLQWKGGHRCRIALAGKYRDGASAIASLADRSRAFIDDWDTRRTESASHFIDQ
jgi:hypothetical protein